MFVRGFFTDFKLDKYVYLSYGLTRNAWGTFDGELCSFFGLNAEMYCICWLFKTRSPCNIYTICDYTSIKASTNCKFFIGIEYTANVNGLIIKLSSAKVIIRFCPADDNNDELKFL